MIIIRLVYSEIQFIHIEIQACLNTTSFFLELDPCQLVIVLDVLPQSTMVKKKQASSDCIRPETTKQRGVTYGGTTQVKVRLSRK